MGAQLARILNCMEVYGKLQQLRTYSSIKKLAVRTQADKLEDFSIGLAEDQQQVRLKVTLPMVAPLSRQRMVAISLGWRPPRQRDERGQQRVQITTEAASLYRA
jgi:hypothetical protein